MHHRHLLLPGLFLLIFGTAFSQNAPLTDKLKALQEDLRVIEGAKETIEQFLEFYPDRPYLVTFTTVAISAKSGDADRTTLELNLAFLDERSVRRTSSRSEMRLEAQTGNDDLIKRSENGEVKGYTNDLTILCQDVDHVRTLLPLLAEAIPLARQRWRADNAIPEAFDELAAWIATRIGNVPTGDDFIGQSLQPLSQPDDRFRLQLNEPGSKGERQRSNLTFSLGDINHRNIKFEVKKDLVILELQTSRSLPFIEITTDGQTDYAKSMEWRFANPSDAKLVEEGLQSLIPLCETKLQARLPDTADGIGVGAFRDLLKSVSRGDESIRQNLDDACLATYTLNLQDDKGATDRRYLFHFEDLDPGSAAITADKGLIRIEVETRESFDCIAHTENDERKNFDDALELLFPDVESARLALHLLPAVIKGCSREMTPRDLNWLRQAVGQIHTADQDDLEQALNSDPDDPCKATFLLTEKGKKTSTSVYDFNWSDLDPDETLLATKGDQVFVELNTKYQEKIISLYADDKDQAFVNTLQLLLPDVETAKTALATVKVTIGECRQ